MNAPVAPDLVMRAQTLRAPADLMPYSNNARIHNEEQIDQIAASIREFGFTNPILTDGDVILAGHGRLRAALKLGLSQVPCIDLCGLSEEQKRAYVIADNKLALNAGWDTQLLAAEVSALEASDFDLHLLGFTEAAIDAKHRRRRNAIPVSRAPNGSRVDAEIIRWNKTLTIGTRASVVRISAARPGAPRRLHRTSER